MKPHAQTNRRGFTLFEVLIIVAVLIGLLAILLPAWRRATARTSKVGCTNHLKQIGLAFKQWALDYGDKFPMQVSVTNGGTMELVDAGNVYVHFLVMSNELNTPKILICPQDADPKRLRATTFASTVPSGTSGQIPFTNDHSVSYFVGVDADETQPQTILTGDANLTVGGVPVSRGMLNLWTNALVSWTEDRHVNQGNIGLADGSVTGVSTPKLRELLVNTRAATNRLAFP
ncbi:MAG: type II secretion system protein [Verrucomicrobia bacterium]|nr:type II secretion system protein [Verrucomicrobiota bacterium]